MINKLYRKVKYQYLKLLRTTGAPSIIARSFSLGIFIEFITLPTLGVAFLFLYPLNVLLRGNFAASLIGFVTGKFVLPVFFMINMSVGNRLINGQTVHVQQMRESAHSSILELVKTKGTAFFLGSVTTGLVMAILCYTLVFYGLIFYRDRKKKKRVAIQLKRKRALN